MESGLRLRNFLAPESIASARLDSSRIFVFLHRERPGNHEIEAGSRHSLLLRIIVSLMSNSALRLCLWICALPQRRRTMDRDCGALGPFDRVENEQVACYQSHRRVHSFRAM